MPAPVLPFLSKFIFSHCFQFPQIHFPFLPVHPCIQKRILYISSRNCRCSTPGVSSVHPVCHIEIGRLTITLILIFKISYTSELNPIQSTYIFKYLNGAGLFIFYQDFCIHCHRLVYLLFHTFFLFLSIGYNRLVNEL